MSGANLDRRSEWPFLRAAAAIVAVVVGVDVAVWAGIDLARTEPTPLEVTVRCLTLEKGVPVDLTPDDELARSARFGALSLVIETNPVTVAVARDVVQAEEIAASYRRLAAEPLDARLVVRGRNVYLFERPWSPTQLQHLLDCQY